MIPVYLAKIGIVKEIDPVIYQEFQNGNWVVNKNRKGSILAELARLAEQAKLMAGTSSKTHTSYHNLTAAVRLREERNVQQLTASNQRFTNPFTKEGPNMLNLVTKLHIPEKVKKDLCDQSVIGNNLFGTFIEERVQTTEKSIWDVLEKRILLPWKITGKTVRVTTKDKIMENAF